MNSFAKNSITADNAETLSYLLYAKYGNSPIANRDENQFKYKVYSVVFRFGPAWEKRLELQNKLRALDDEEIRLGSRSINNHAFNPSTSPTTSTLDELLEINEQSSQGLKMGKMEAYATLYQLIQTDVTTEFIDKFSECFKQFVMPEFVTLYEGDE